MPFEKIEMVGTQFGSRVVTRRVGVRKLECLCSCGREGVFFRQALTDGRAAPCKCSSAVIGLFGVPLGEWRNDRKFKCSQCHQWRPHYYETSVLGLCGSCHG